MVNHNYEQANIHFSLNRLLIFGLLNQSEMKYIILAIAVSLSLPAFSQTTPPKAEQPVHWNIKRDGETINMNFPPGTFLNGSGKLVIDGMPVNIELNDINEFINKDGYPDLPDDIKILINYTTKNIKQPVTYEEQNTRQMEYKKSEKGHTMVFWHDTFVYDDKPTKFKAARVSGNAILTLTIDNSASGMDADKTKELLYSILNDTTVTQDPKQVIPKT